MTKEKGNKVDLKVRTLALRTCECVRAYPYAPCECVLSVCSSGFYMLNWTVADFTERTDFLL